MPILLRKGWEQVDQQTPFDEKVYGETATKVQILKQEDFCLKSHNKKWEISFGWNYPQFNDSDNWTSMHFSLQIQKF